MLFRVACILLAFATPLLAQDRQGRDTPGEWVVDHTKHFGLWDSMCDHRTTGETREERCYLRYVEVFSRDPFAALFLFVTPGPEIEIGIERGTRFEDQGIRIEDANGTTLWTTDRRSCLRGRACTFEGEEAKALYAAMRDGAVFAFDFADPSGTERALRWDLTRMGEASADFADQSVARALPGS